MKTTKLLFIAFITALLLYSCKDNSVNPEDKLLPGSRNYQWSVDTLLASPGDLFEISRLSGSSPNDVWGIGGNTSTAATQLWHFNGKKWSKPSPSTYITALYVFSKSNAWYFTNNSFYHYDGSNWSKFGEYKLTGYDRTFIYNIWGSASNDIYAVGYADNNRFENIQSVLMHFDGYGWGYINLPPLKVQFIEIAKKNNTGEYIIGGIFSTSNEYTGKVYIYKNDALKEIYSGVGPATVNYLNGEVYVGIKQKIYKVINDKLTLWRDLTGTSYIGKIWGGNNAFDFFAGAYDGVGHYNGIDFKTVYKVKEGFYSQTGIFIKDNFFIAWHNLYDNTNIIVRGKKIN